MIIDTCAFRDGAFIEALKRYHGRKCISPVTYTEMQVYLMGKKDKPQDYFDNILRKSNIEIVILRKKEAIAAVEIAIGKGEYNRNSRDYMIAAHAFTAPWLVITYNKRDFDYPGERVYEPGEFKKLKIEMK